MSDIVEIWERIGFRNGEAVTWHRSFDSGKTWEAVSWLGDKLPFVCINTPGELDSITEARLMSSEEARKIWPSKMLARIVNPHAVEKAGDE